MTEKIYVNSRLVSAPRENGYEIRDLHQKFQICSDSKTVFRFGIWITLRTKMSPAPPPLKSSGLPRYNNLGQISWCWKIVIFKNFKFAPIRKRFRDSGSASLCHKKFFLKKKFQNCKNVPHTTSQILRVTEIQQFRSNQLTLKNR